MFYCAFCLLMCVINLAYVEPLKVSNVIKYIIANPHSVGSPTMALIKAIILMFWAAQVWMLGTHGWTPAIFCAVLDFLLCGLVFRYWKDKSDFDPNCNSETAYKWQWTEKHSNEWPFIITMHGPQVQNIFRVLAKMEDVHASASAPAPSSLNSEQEMKNSGKNRGPVGQQKLRS